MTNSELRVKLYKNLESFEKKPETFNRHYKAFCLLVNEYYAIVEENELSESEDVTKRIGRLMKYLDVAEL